MKRDIITLPGGAQTIVWRGGTGPVVVWLHGPHGLRGRDPVVAELMKRFTVIAPLAPGFNDGAEIHDIDTVHDLALHYDSVFEVLGLDRITLIGHSFGAMIAAEYAAHFPRRVEKLVLLSPFGLWRDDHPVTDLFSAPYATFNTLLWKSGEASPEMSDPADEPNDPVEKQVQLAQALTAVAKFIWPIPDRNLRRRLPRVTADTLILVGADDKFVPPLYGAEFAKEIRGAKSMTVADAAHMAPYEKTEETFRILREFLPR